MTTLLQAVDLVLKAQEASGKPLATILAGHNGSGKSTMWYQKGLAEKLQIPLINADRMMLSILPDAPLPTWAQEIRDSNPSWMRVAQKGVEAFVAQAMIHQVPFAMETVFSHWKVTEGKVESKIDLIRQLQNPNDYFVVLIFVGLADVGLSVAHVMTRFATGGHNVDTQKLLDRFPRTQAAIKHAVGVADAAILVDNSGDKESAFTVCRVQMGEREVYDWRGDTRRKNKPSPAVLQWLDKVSPR